MNEKDAHDRLIDAVWVMTANSAVSHKAMKPGDIRDQLSPLLTAVVFEGTTRRLCVAPDCWRQYNAAEPGIERGWWQSSAILGALCPDHSWTMWQDGHEPHWKHDYDNDTSRLLCGCGWDSGVVGHRATGHELWKDHIARVISHVKALDEAWKTCTQIAERDPENEEGLDAAYAAYCDLFDQEDHDFHRAMRERRQKQCIISEDTEALDAQYEAYAEQLVQGQEDTP
jgi:hypothetical protein